MAKICYVPRRFKPESLGKIEAANEIIAEYRAQGYTLTLRQLYYQFVARDMIPNTEKSYKGLGSIINDARLAGLIEWDAMVDRTRNLRSLAHWGSVADIIDSCSTQYRIDKWATQRSYVEVWIEKDALVGVIEDVCEDNDVPFFSCRGYTSQSEMHSAAMRLKRKARSGRDVTILHLGDHDPSGIDMTRDIQDRLNLFTRPGLINVNRIALNMDQIEEFGPPPNPAKLSDARAHDYVARFGHESWELDSLEPRVMSNLILENIEALRDDIAWEEACQTEEDGKERLSEIAEEER